MRKFITVAFALLAMLGAQFAAVAADNGTADEAKAMVEKAASLVAKDGKEKAYAAFNDPAGGFVDRDLYVFVIALGDGTVVAHGANKALIGKSLLNLKDSNGKFFVQDMIAVAKSDSSGWVDYKWASPTTKKVEGKSSYVKKIDDVLIGVGIYKG